MGIKTDKLTHHTPNKRVGDMTTTESWMNSVYTSTVVQCTVTTVTVHVVHNLDNMVVYSNCIHNYTQQLKSKASLLVITTIKKPLSVPVLSVQNIA